MTSEAKAGAVVLLVVAVAIVAWGQLGGLSILRGTYDVVVYFDDLLGLSEGAVVRLQGARVGEVHRVGVVDAEHPSKFPPRLAWARIRIQNETLLYHGDTFQVASGTLLGDRHVRVTRVTPSGTVIADTDPPQEIAGSAPGGIDALASQAESIADQANKAMGNLDALLGDPELQANLKDTFANLKTLSVSASAIANKTLTLVEGLGPEDTDKVTGIVDNLHAVSQSLRRTAAGINAMVATTTLPEDMEEISRHLVDASESVAGTVDTVEEIIGDPKTETDIRDIMGNARDATGQATVALEKATSVLEHVDNIAARADETSADFERFGDSIKAIEAEGYIDFRVGDGSSGRIDVGADLYPDRHKDEFWRVGVRDLGGGGEKLDLQRGFPLDHRNERLRIGLMAGEVGVGYDREWSPRLSTEAEIIDPDKFRVDIKGKYRYDPEWDLLFGVDRALSGSEPFIGARRHFDF